MRLPRSAGRRRARIEIIPLIDIMFFLLATFIMVSLSMVQNLGIAVNLPSAHSAKAQDEKPAVAVSVAKDGSLYWGKQSIALADLPARFQALEASDPEAKVVLQGDTQADFGTVVKVLDAARQAGIKRTAVRTKHQGS